MAGISYLSARDPGQPSPTTPSFDVFSKLAGPTLWVLAFPCYNKDEGTRQTSTRPSSCGSARSPTGTAAPLPTSPPLRLCLRPVGAPTPPASPHRSSRAYHRSWVPCGLPHPRLEQHYALEHPRHRNLHTNVQTRLSTAPPNPNSSDTRPSLRAGTCTAAAHSHTISIPITHKPALDWGSPGLFRCNVVQLARVRCPKVRHRGALLVV